MNPKHCTYCVKPYDFVTIKNIKGGNNMTTRYISPGTIEDLAEKVRKDAGLNDSEPGAVDAVKLAQFFGCEVEEVTFNPQTISARIKRDVDSTRYIIQISRDDEPKRQRFSIAHEVAHLLLHDDGKESFIEWRKKLSEYGENDLYKEIQANMLSSALLMPKALVERAWKESRDIEDLASIFNVSRSAAYYRVENLGLLSGE